MTRSPALSYAEHGEHVAQMIEAALAAADPAQAVRRYLKRDEEYLILGPYRYRFGQGRIFVIAAGKAGLLMGKAALEVLQNDVGGGVIITKHTQDGRARSYRAAVGADQARIIVYEAGHPVSDESSIQATAAVIRLLEETRAGDLVLCLISGGASALLTRPTLALPLWQRLLATLLESGCTINELNSVRKHLDRIKGGGLAQLAAPAAVVSLILSDVVGNPLDVVGSGPTAPNPESPAEALTVLHRYRIAEKLPTEAWERISEHLTADRTPTSLARFEELEVENMIIGDVRRAARAAARVATDLGFKTHLLTTHLEGEAREVGRVVAALAKDAAPGTCLILGGETTVTVSGDGRGGRNQELALAAALSLDGWEHVAVASFATDGEDGPTDAAGAIITGHTIAQARAAGLLAHKFLQRNDSYTFFNALAEHHGIASLIQTGPTGTNVNDLCLILAYPRA